MKPGVILDAADFGALMKGHPLFISIGDDSVGLSLDLSSFTRPLRRRPTAKVRRAKRSRRLFPHGVDCSKCGKHFEWPGQIAGHRARGECKKGR